MTSSAVPFPGRPVFIELVFIALPALVFWCFSEKKGLLLGMAALFSAWVSTLAGGSFPAAVIAAILALLAALGLYALFGGLFRALLNAGGMRAMIITAAAAAFLMNAFSPGDARLGGAFFGLCAGYALMLRHIRFSAREILFNSERIKIPKTIFVMFFRFLAGTAIAFALYFVLKALLPGPSSAHYRLAGFLRSALLGLWVSAGAPWLFLRLGLAGQGLAGQGFVKQGQKTE